MLRQWKANLAVNIVVNIFGLKVVYLTYNDGHFECPCFGPLDAAHARPPHADHLVSVRRAEPHLV